MENDDLLRLDNQLCFRLYALLGDIQDAYRPLLEALGLTFPQYLIMMALWEHDGLNQTTLARRVAMDLPQLTPLLRRLEAKALIVRTRSRTDERQRLIALTPSGRELHAQAGVLPRDVRCRLALSNEEIALFAGLMDRARHNLAANRYADFELLPY